MTSDKASRWLDLVAYLLQHRFPVTREQVFNHVTGYKGGGESARRKFERDKDELRASGIDIETVPVYGAAGDEPATGYRLRPRGAYLPYLEFLDEPRGDQPYALDRIVLTAHELETLDRATRALAAQRGSPLAEAAASARRKLAFDLPLSDSEAERVLAMPVAEHTRQALAVLQEAVIRRVAVRCSYSDLPRHGESRHDLEPWGLVFQWGRWYCVARSTDSDELRLFRVDRMSDARLLPGSPPAFDVPSAFDIRRFVGLAPWEFGTSDPVPASARFAFPQSRWVANRKVGRVARTEPDRSAVFEFQVRDSESFLRWILTFGRHAELLEPVSLRDSLAELRANVAALYAESAL